MKEEVKKLFEKDALEQRTRQVMQDIEGLEDDLSEVNKQVFLGILWDIAEMAKSDMTTGENEGQFDQVLQLIIRDEWRRNL